MIGRIAADEAIARIMEGWVLFLKGLEICQGDKDNDKTSKENPGGIRKIL